MAEQGLLAAVRRSQVWRSIFRHEHRGDDRDRVLRVSSSVLLHVHPTKVRRHGLRLRFTWGMGGISLLLFLVLVVSGTFLMLHVRPTPEHVRADVVALAGEVPAGRFLRNVHHFGGNALVIAVGLHLLRVFMTGSYKPPREANWVVGVALLVLTVALGWTGHLLPLGESAPALLRAYVLHCVLLPLAVGLFSATHFFRVRKDGGISGPP